eukprot:TRINITY_DN10019_c0_g1_i1.p1 TRINITY_DN10019_c0_g1~~TRINITY_DN10019_c0_g1_i1.p1  ORF type:complete len:206 (+),score=67.42 TRINITY_DN10019_c0_g1_i1:64-618(+)
MAAMGRLAAACCLFLAGAAGCDERTAALRSPRVLHGFRPEVLAGTWYEVAYTDIGQVGARCGRSVNTADNATGELLQRFTVDYGPLPFSMRFRYRPDGPPGLYHQMGNNTFRVAIVDVDPQGGSGIYIEYKCALGVATELRMSARVPNVTAATVQQMVETCREVGIAESVLGRVKQHDNSKCRY